MAVGNALIQQLQDRQSYVWQYINGAYEFLRDDRDGSLVPEIRLKEGWKNGNIIFSTSDPPVIPPDPIPDDYDGPHTWDLWVVVADDATKPDWWEMQNIYVRKPR